VHACFAKAAEVDVIAVLFRDDSIALWDTLKLTELAVFRLPASEARAHLRSFAVSSDGRFLAAAGRSRSLYVWELSTTDMFSIVELPQTIRACERVEFAADSATLAVIGDDGKLRFIDVRHTCSTAAEQPL